MSRNRELRVLDRLNGNARVAVVRIRSLGDSVLTTPAVALLKQARPDLRVAVVSEPRFFAVWEGNADVETVMPPSMRALRAFRPALCLNLHGGPRSARLTALSGAVFRAGFTHFPYQRVYNVGIPRAQQILGIDGKVHTAEHAASAVIYLGAENGVIPRAKLFAAQPLPELASPGPYAVIHPMASEAAKTWPAQRFLSVAQHLKRERGLQPVFIAGPGEDVSPFQMWPVVAGADLETIKALLSQSVLFVGNDSGPAHMAAAFGVPVVTIFGPSDPEIWAPWRTDSRVLVARGAIESVSEQTVIDALEQIGVAA